MASLVPYIAVVDPGRLARAGAMQMDRSACAWPRHVHHGFVVGDYVVHFHLLGPSCTCLDATKRRRFVCKHVLCVLLHLGFESAEIATLNGEQIRAAIEREAIERVVNDDM